VLKFPLLHPDSASASTEQTSSYNIYSIDSLTDNSFILSHIRLHLSVSGIMSIYFLDAQTFANQTRRRVIYNSTSQLDIKNVIDKL